MEQEIKLLIINPGSTSTKISIFENGVERYKKSLSHPASEVARYARATRPPSARRRWRNFWPRLTMICPA